MGQQWDTILIHLLRNGPILGAQPSEMLHPTLGKRAEFAYRNLARGKNRKMTEAEMKPIMLVHDAKDEVVNITSTDEFVEKMKTAGAAGTYLRFADGHRGVMGQKGRVTKPAMEKFFKEHLAGTSSK